MNRRLARIVVLLIKVYRRLWMLIQLPLFKKRGCNVRIGHGCDFSYDSIELGNDVYIGPHAIFMSAISAIKIGNKVMFGPHVTILGGDHRTNVVGAYMFDVTEKLPGNDLDVVIEDDVWVGAHALLLKGVRIGRGSIIGAGSVVTKNVPPYSVYVGSPGLKVWPRWDAATQAEHERHLERGPRLTQGD